MKIFNIQDYGLWQKIKQTACCGFLLLFTNCGRTGDIPLLETPEWKMNLEYEIGISLKREETAGNDGALLIKHDKMQPFVRRYDPRLKTMEIAPPEIWNKSTAPAVVCDGQFAPDPKFLAVNPETERLTDENGNAVSTEGTNILNLTKSPQGNLVAILSASGFAGSEYSILPFGSGSGASGQYRHQVYSIESRRIVSPAVRIPTRQSFSSLRACWSADEKFVVYYEVTFSFFSVVHVE